MGRVAPFFSKLPTDVYHNNSQLPGARAVEEFNRVSGTGGKRLCEQCQECNDQPSVIASESLTALPARRARRRSGW